MTDASARHILNHMMLVEAINSVAMSHEPDCGCNVCRAADGDQRAFAEIMEQANAADR